MADYSALPRSLMLIDGEPSASANGAFFAVENPARRSLIAEVPRADHEDVDRAVRAAARAFEGWRREPARERGRRLLRIADDLEAHSEELARLIASETGNALRTQARNEARITVDLFRYFGGLASELKGETIPLGEQVLSYTRREPFGVVGGIIPWNAPAMLAAAKIAPALCAGNTIVLKAAEDAPLAVLLLAHCCNQHLPPGTLNLLTGFGEECGTPLVRHPLVRKLTFTGSTEVGHLIMSAASERIVPVSLELGGKSPAIVCPDATDERVVDGVISAMRFTRMGQSCTAGSRLLLHASVFDEFLERVCAKVNTLAIGDPLDEQSDIGALISRRQFDRVCDYIAEGLEHPEAQIVTGGLPPQEGPLAQGYFVRPTIFQHTSNNWRLAREEIFGPVLVAIPWFDEDQVIRMANDSHYGLAAFIWTHDIAKGLRMAHAVEAGYVQVNQGLGQQLGQSYGGYKQSGIGRELSLEGMLDSFTQRKSVTVSLTF